MSNSDPANVSRGRGQQVMLQLCVLAAHVETEHACLGCPHACPNSDYCWHVESEQADGRSALPCFLRFSSSWQELTSNNPCHGTKTTDCVHGSTPALSQPPKQRTRNFKLAYMWNSYSKHICKQVCRQENWLRETILYSWWINVNYVGFSDLTSKHIEYQIWISDKQGKCFNTYASNIAYLN